MVCSAGRFILCLNLVLVCSCVFRSFWRCSWCFSCVCSICACLVLSVSSSSWCLERIAVCDWDTPWTFLLPFFYSTDRSKAVVPVLVLLLVALCFILRGDLFYVSPCVILFVCFSVLLAL